MTTNSGGFRNQLTTSEGTCRRTTSPAVRLPRCGPSANSNKTMAEMYSSRHLENRKSGVLQGVEHDHVLAV